jgi:type I restriction enzyme M protein
MGIVLPDAILGAPGLIYVRYWLIKHCRIVASIDLHPDTFQPMTGVKTSLLILQKKQEKEIYQEVLQDYEIFMAQVRSIGYDKRGNPVYKRNEDGEEILLPSDETTQSSQGKKQSVVNSFSSYKKVLDDDTPYIADAFLHWKKEMFLKW